MSVVGYMGIDLNFNAYPIEDGRSCTVIIIKVCFL